MWVQSLGWEDTLEESMATDSSIVAWRIQWTEEPGGLQTIGSQRVRPDWRDLAWLCQECEVLHLLLHVMDPGLRNWTSGFGLPKTLISLLLTALTLTLGILMSGSYSKLLKEKDYLICPLLHTWASLVAQMVKNLLAMPQTWVWSLGQEDPLEKGLSTHFSILAWRIPWTGEPGELQSMASPRVGHDWVTNTLHTQHLADL